MRQHLVDENLLVERVEVERIPIGRTIEAAPPVRTEGDTIVISVVEEVVVVQRKLFLKEEIRLQRVQTTERHVEKVILREQKATIERVDQVGEGASRSTSLGDGPTTLSNHGDMHMTNQTIVAVYDTASQAAAAVRDLDNAGVPSDGIAQHAANRTTSEVAMPAGPDRKPGFWASLFGGEPEREYDTTVYDRSLESGSTVVTVQVSEQELSKVTEILERHSPIDIDERAASYDSEKMAETTRSPVRMPLATDTTSARSTDDQTIQLAEEKLAVGKRAINRGTTRVRRYVVETPVEEQVSLRDETVVIERRPVMDNRPVTDANFTDKVVEMAETEEQAVVSKTARIKEELVIHKDTNERTETVRDTVRREDAEITKEADAENKTTTADATARSERDPNNPKI